jgi:hypothetical protein
MSGKGAKGLSGKGAKGTMAKGDKKKPVSRSLKAGLQFPVGRIHRFLKVRTCDSALGCAQRKPATRRSLATHPNDTLPSCRSPAPPLAAVSAPPPRCTALPSSVRALDLTLARFVQLERGSHECLT